MGSKNQVDLRNNLLTFTGEELGRLLLDDPLQDIRFYLFEFVIFERIRFKEKI